MTATELAGNGFAIQQPAHISSRARLQSPASLNTPGAGSVQPSEQELTPVQPQASLRLGIALQVLPPGLHQRWQLSISHPQCTAIAHLHYVVLAASATDYLERNKVYWAVGKLLSCWHAIPAEPLVEEDACNVLCSLCGNRHQFSCFCEVINNEQNPMLLYCWVVRFALLSR